MTTSRLPCLDRSRWIVKHVAVVLTAAALAVALPACNLLIPFIFIGEHKKTVPPEFARLTKGRTALLVWAQQETLFDYPQIRLELATYITDKMRARLRDADFVDPVEVEDHVQRNMYSSFDPQRVGREFGADYVVYLELLEFQIRDVTAPDFLRGRVRASVAVYDLNAAPDDPKRYELDPVETVYPDEGPVLFTPANAVAVRQETYVKTAELVARKFFEHQEEL